MNLHLVLAGQKLSLRKTGRGKTNFKGDLCWSNIERSNGVNNYDEKGEGYGRDLWEIWREKNMRVPKIVYSNLHKQLINFC